MRRVKLSRGALIAFILLSGFNIASADNIEVSELPNLMKLRFDEDYSDIQKQDTKDSFIYSLKGIPLSNTSDAYLSIGGEIRLRYDYLHNPGVGEDPQDKHGAFLQRYTIHADVHLNPNYRLFVQLYSALETGRNGGPSPVDENKLEFQNAFVDYSFDTDASAHKTIRLGRQEIYLGSGRLVDVREGPNVRRTFDGGRLMLGGEQVSSNIIALRPRIVKSEAFDDRSNKDEFLWGLYTTITYNNKNNQVDVYYLGFNDDNGAYEQGVEHEKRHSLGTRLSGEIDSWDYNWEFVYQFGEFGDGDIRAWTLATETGHQWKKTNWQPRLGLSVNVASGDKDPDDSNLESFNALYPRGNYFSEVAILGPRNFYNLHPSLTITPDDNWTFIADVNFYWRYETSDGVYGPSGNLVRSSSGSSERFVSTVISLSSEWSISRELAFTAIYSHLIPEAFLKDTGTSEKMDFIELTVQYKF